MSRSGDCYAMDDEDWDAMGVRTLEECGFDRMELLVLDLLRHFCMTFADAGSHGWLHAFRHAERHLGAERGAALAFSVSEYLNALRSERLQPFNFVDPWCDKCAKRVFPTEYALMMALRGARLHDAGLLHTCVLQIVERGEGRSTTLAAHALAVSVGKLSGPAGSDYGQRHVPSGAFLH